jgi:heterotetrameric sarcosine oxidase gamma subunit
VLEHRAPLHRLSPALYAEATDQPDLRVMPIEDRGLLLLQGEPGDVLLHDAILRQIGVRVPGPQATSIRGDYALLWMTPKEWLLELPAAETLAVQLALITRLVPALAAVTDVSDSLALFDVSGDRAVEVLMTGCSINLRSDAFTAGHVARTAVADVPAIIWKANNSFQFRCLVERSYAEHFWNWLAKRPARW